MQNEYRLTDFLPTTRKELDLRGWDEVDVILFSGDAYVDHPSFGAAVIGRLIESLGLRIAIVPQPDWRGDHRDFTKLGKPRLFFAVSAGNMDSMVNHYTAGKRLRSDDAYTADGKAGARPDYATIVYTSILKKLYPDTPVLIGGIEASLRRLSHYDYWSDALKTSVLVESGADILVYGMGEKPVTEICTRMMAGESFAEIRDVKQTVIIQTEPYSTEDYIRLHSHEDCLQDKRKQAENFRHIEEESNRMSASVLVQQTNHLEVVVNPPFPPLTSEELDRSYEFPYTREPHPKYKGKTIPAFEMIKFSVNIHRGCFGGCAFCTISAHQGKFIMNRSKESVLKEVEILVQKPDFKGYLSDLGGPSANMYKMQGYDLDQCAVCKRPSCIHPKVCKNLNTDHGPLLDLYQSVDRITGIKKSFIGSGIRYDLILHSASKNLKENASESQKRSANLVDKNSLRYVREVINNHVSGRLKVAPEHTSEPVLMLMRKPAFEQFKTFNALFEKLDAERMNISNKSSQKTSGKQQLIPYFISSHPGSTNKDMAHLADETKRLNFKLEQVQDFTPTPMTLATEMYYTGLHPYSLKPVFTAKSRQEKEKQRSFFFWYETKQPVKKPRKRF